MYLILKALISGLVIAVASEAARRSPLLGAILISLPLTSILALSWLYRDTGDAEQVVELSWSILWVIVPSVVFFIVLPLAVRSGVGVAAALLLSCVATGAAYAAWIWVARRLGLPL